MGTRTNKSVRSTVFVFDFGGVIIKWKNNYPIYDSIARRYGVPRTKLRKIFDASLPELEAGRISTRDFIGHALGAVGTRLREGDIPEELWTEPFARLAKLREGTVSIVASLRRRGVRVYLFSNTSAPHATYLREVGWDKLFDGFVASCEIGATKPSPEAFERVLEAISAAPSEVAFIDDKEQNVRGAKKFGVRWSFRFVSVARLKRDIAQVSSEVLIGRSPPRGTSESSA